MKTKVCIKCRITKSIIEFSKDRTRKNGYCNWCKECANKYNKKYYQKNSVKILKQQKKYWKNNKQEITIKRKKYFREYMKRYRLKHGIKLIKTATKWNQIHKKEVNERKKKYFREKYGNNINYKLTLLLRSRIYYALKRNVKSNITKKLLGCSLEQLKQHIQKQFKPGMTWENHNFKGWHIDHIIPCASFDLSKTNEQRKCFNYTNLQPLWAEENLSKGKRLERR